MLNKSISEVSTKKLVTKNMIIDSGCNSTCINNEKHSDIPIVYNRMDQPKDSVQVADGRTISVTGSGGILNHNSSLVPEFENSLLSVSEITKSNNAIAIFTDTNCHIFK